jgi:hypothetical protein
VLVFAAARLARVAPGGHRLRAGTLAAAGAILLGASWSGRPAALGAVLPFLGHFAFALGAAAAWAVAGRSLPRTAVVAGVSAILAVGIVEGACVHEDLFRVRRDFAREVRDLAAGTGAPVVVLGMSLPSVAFYADRPVTIAAEPGRLALEERAWGESPLFRAEADVREILRTDWESILVVKEDVLAAVAPERRPLARGGGVVAVRGFGTVGPVR